MAVKPKWFIAMSSEFQKIYEAHFLPSFIENGLAETFDLETRAIDYRAGQWGEKEYAEFCVTEMRRTLCILQEHKNEVVVFSGVDFRFYADISETLLNAVETHDVVTLDDAYCPACGDFLAFRMTDKIIGLYEWMIEHNNEFEHQQTTLNAALKELKFKVHSLSEKFWTFGMQSLDADGHLRANHIWTIGREVCPPKRMQLHHANFCIGAENKMALLNAVLEQSKNPACRVMALMSLPRLGFTDTFACLHEIFLSNGIRVATYGAMWWEKGLQNLLQGAIDKEYDFAICIDYDTMADEFQLHAMMTQMLDNQHVDALTCLQARREHGSVMGTVAEKRDSKVTVKCGELMQLRTGHFGFTIIRLDRLKEVPKPWFMNLPSGSREITLSNGNRAIEFAGEGLWRQDAPGQCDADIYFWLQWEKAGRTLFALPGVQIGHIEPTLSVHNPLTGRAKYIYAKDWKRRNDVVPLDLHVKAPEPPQCP